MLSMGKERESCVLNEHVHVYGLHEQYFGDQGSGCSQCLKKNLDRRDCDMDLLIKEVKLSVRSLIHLSSSCIAGVVMVSTSRC